MKIYATVEDMVALFRPLSVEERTRAESLLKTVSSNLRIEAKKIGKDLDAMIEADEDLGEVAKGVTVDVVARVLNTSTDSEPMSQVTQSAMGYSVSGTYLIPGGGLFIKNAELERLGLRRQRYGAMEIYDVHDQGDNNPTME